MPFHQRSLAKEWTHRTFSLSSWLLLQMFYENIALVQILEFHKKDSNKMKQISKKII